MCKYSSSVQSAFIHPPTVKLSPLLLTITIFNPSASQLPKTSKHYTANTKSWLTVSNP